LLFFVNRAIIQELFKKGSRKMYKFLDKINTPEDLKQLNIQDLPELCDEIRDFLVTKVSKTGGHLAPNLGVVELTVALHYIFNSPNDKFIFDVGHQCYVHKILTGRKNDFDTLRKMNGLSGFPKPYESEHDIYNSGHSSTSIAAATGIATANKISGNPNYTIAIIGDGALTGGLAFEGLNNSNSKDLNLIVILNDNKMSISKSVGGIAKSLNKFRSTTFYTTGKKDVRYILQKIPFFGRKLHKFVSYIKNGIKHLFIPTSNFFEQFGYTYLGPINGNDVNSVADFLERAKNVRKPVLLHIITKKGKGYLPAEKNPNKFHGISPFNKETGEVLSKSSGSYSSKFGEVLVNEAEKNDKIVAITAAMCDGVGLNEFSKKFKYRFFDVTIAEAYGTTFASGLAVQGFIPFFACYSTFLQRAYDEIVHDVALQNLHVVFAIDRAGIVGQDGETHQGLLDESYLVSIPNFTLIAPKDGKEFEYMIKFCIKHNGPIAIRYPRGNYKYELIENEIIKPIELGKAEIIKEGTDVTLIGYGKTVDTLIQVANMLKKKKISAEVINLRFLKPIDKETICSSVYKTKCVVTLEDAYLKGGVASEVQNLLFNQKDIKSLFLGYPDEFIRHGTQAEIEELYGLDKKSITKKIFKLLDKK